jgi:hypothetical protein
MKIMDSSDELLTEFDNDLFTALVKKLLIKLPTHFHTLYLYWRMDLNIKGNLMVVSHTHTM